MIRRTLSLASAFLILLALVACGGNGAQNTADMTVEQIAENTIQAFQGLQSFQGALDVSFTTPQTGQLSLNATMQGGLAGAALGGEPPNFRGEITSSSIEGLPVGTVAVFAPTSYFYNPAENVVYTANRTTPGGASQLYRLPMLFISTMNETLQNLTSPAVNQTIVGEETLGSFTTVKIEAVPAEGATGGPLAAGEKSTIWIDTATNIPVQVIFSSPEGEQKMTITSMQVNGSVDTAAFTFEPPAGAEVVELGPPSTVADLDEASDEAGFTAPTPGYLPEGVDNTPTTVSIQETPAGFIIMQTYGAGGDQGTIHIDTIQLTGGLEQLPASPPPGAASSTVDINGQSALLLVIREGQAALSLRQGDFLYTIRGNGFGQEEVIQIAENLETE